MAAGDMNDFANDAVLDTAGALHCWAGKVYIVILVRDDLGDLSAVGHPYDRPCDHQSRW